MIYNKGVINQIRLRLRDIGIDAILVNSQYDIIYLTGFYSPGVVLVIPAYERPLYFIDKMNRALAISRLKHEFLDIITGSGIIIEIIAEQIRIKKIKNLGVGADSVSFLMYKNLCKSIPAVKIISERKGIYITSIIKDLRKIKTAEEIDVLRKAAKETIRIWRKVKRNIKTGMNEKEIEGMVDSYIREKGYKNSFSTISAIGKNSAYPHAIAGHTKIKNQEHLLVDFGIRYHGYCSDLTRTWDNGRIDRKIKVFKRFVREAHDFAINNIRPGVQIGLLVKKVNSIFQKAGLGDFVLHGLGHGVGLNIHEEPFLRQTSQERFKRGMVVTVEPGLYEEGLGGIREEDMVLVTSKGCEVLTR
ncbi:MAG: Xaa-Pro peptidase family protein [Candidatus Omnitrophota bacterium]